FKFKNFKIILSMLMIVFFTSSTSFCNEVNPLRKCSKLIPLGEVVVINLNLKYPLVSYNLNKDAKLKESDIIVSIFVNNEEIALNPGTIEEIMKQENLEIKVNYIRNKTLKSKNITSDNLRLSVLSFNPSCIGTITAIDEYGNFVGLSHSIKNSGVPLPFSYGNVFETSYIQSEKGCFLKPGSLATKSTGNLLGIVKDMGDGGVVGKLDNYKYNNKKALDIASPKEGKAYIYCKSSISNEFKMHEIEILDVKENTSKIKVIDKELLKYRGGVVHGMSGSPVIQDNKLVGGVRSVFKHNKDIGIISNIDYMLNNSNN
ncbi:MAG: SpoIVB peptidase S55 domain-containing protein, partial [Peptostreptococcaceae bacterium]